MTHTCHTTLLRGTEGAVACGHPLAVGAALEVLGAGGGAADAAIAAAAVLSVVLPDACGLGGDAMILVAPAGREPIAFNGSGAAPSGARPPLPPDGPGTVSVPGAVAAWGDLHAQFGRLELGRALAPAVRIAEGGFAVGEPLLATVEAQMGRLAAHASSFVFLEPGLRPGSRVRQPKLAETLRIISAEGPDALYHGAISEAIVRATQGHLTSADLEAHRTEILPPLQGYFGDATILVQPPVSQAALALMVIRGLATRDDHDAEARTHVAIEFVEAAFAHRDRLAVPGAATELVELDLDIDPERAARRGGPRGYNHTTTVTVADAEGTVVSMLLSVFDDFGSAVLVPEGSFMLNDRLLGFTADPASPNALAPGRRPIHTLSPTVVRHAGRVMALATPGADGQVQTLVQLIDRIVWHGDEIPRALGLPRWRSIDREVAIESGFDEKLAAGLRRRGHKLRPMPFGHVWFGAACCAGVDESTGTLFAAVDGRRETWAGVL